MSANLVELAKTVAGVRTCPKCRLQVPADTKLCPQDGTDLSAGATPISMLGDRYEFLGAVGSGGIGIVYKARQKLLDKAVAIKMLQANLPSQSAILRFQREAQAASRLSHPNVIGVHDFGVTADDRPYMVMDWAEGDNLSAVIEKQGALSVSESLDVFIQVCEGLAHAHSYGILHRDLKPSNLMLGRDGQGKLSVKILDFGLAKFIEAGDLAAARLTQTGEAVGSPLYMSPEQGLAKSVDGRTDLYSLGCVMFEALTGNPPFIGETVVSTFLKHQDEKPLSLKEATLGKDFPASLEQVVARLLEKQPRNRYQSADELLADLTAIQAGKPLCRPANTNGDKGTKKSLPDAKMAVLLALVLALVLGTVVWMASLLNISSKTQAHVSLDVQDMLVTLYASLLRDDSDICQRIKENANLGTLACHGEFVTDESTVELSKATNLQDLRLDRTAITDAGFKRLAHLPLRSLNLVGTKVTDASLETIGSMYALKTLVLSRTAIKGSGLSSLSNLKHLVSLSLDHTGVDDDSMSSGWLKDIDQLETLEIGHSQVADEGMAQIAANLKSLNTLSLEANEHITARGIGALGSLPYLYGLDLNSTSIHDADLSALPRLKKLTALSLGDTAITAKVFDTIATLPDLKVVCLTGCKNISEAEINRFRRQHPRLEVRRHNMEKDDSNSEKRSLRDALLVPSEPL